MTTIALDKIKFQKIGKMPVVVLPLEEWKEIEADLEDLEMYRSKIFKKEIEKRRKEKIIVPLEKLLKKYRI